MSIVAGVGESNPPVAGVANFFIAPLTIGILSHFIKLYQGANPSLETMFVDGFSTNYLRKVGGNAWVMLWTFLWTLLFIIPGIVKAISYAMTPYILARCPNVKATDAIKLSMRITDGYKTDLFMFYLSFIGWWILSAITFGIVAIFYVGPYYAASISGYYDELFKNALNRGAITKNDLGGYDGVYNENTY